MFLINSNFEIWQRWTSVSLTATGRYFGPDRWKLFRGAYAAGMTASRQSGIGVSGAMYCLRVQRDAGNTAGQYLSLSQTMETVDSIKYIGKRVTLSFWARAGANFSSADGLLAAYVIRSTGTDARAEEGVPGYTTVISSNVALTTSWKKFTLTAIAPVDAATNTLYVEFAYAPVGTAGAADYYEIAQVQLTNGPYDIPYQFKSFAQELRDCMRYYEKSYPYTDYSGTTNSARRLGYYFAGTNLFTSNSRFNVPFLVPKRVTPTATIYSNALGTKGKASDGSNADKAVSAIYVSETGFELAYDEPTPTTGIFFNYTAEAEI